MKTKKRDEPCEKTRQKLGKEIVLTITFREKDLFLLRKTWRRKHNRELKKFPKLVVPFTDEVMVKYIVWEAGNKELEKIIMGAMEDFPPKENGQF